MKIGTFMMTAGLLGMALVNPGNQAKAQGPLWDVVHVNLPYTVTVGDKTLDPGEYTIEQNHGTGGGAKVLLIYSDKGLKFETSAMTIPALDPDTARHTEVILGKLGSDYYMQKVWIQGKDYGYEIPVPNRLKDRQKEMASVSVAANYSSKSSDSTTVASNTQTDQTKSDQNKADVSETTPATSAEARPVQNPPANAEQATTPANPPVTTDTNSADRMAATPATSANTSASTSTAANANNSADRMVESTPASTPESMPATSAGWLMMLIGGGSLSGVGLVLRRKRQ